MGLLLIINTPLVIRARYLCDSLYRSLLSLAVFSAYVSFWCFVLSNSFSSAFAPPGRSHQSPVLAVWMMRHSDEYTVKSCEVDLRLWHKRGQLCDEVQGIEYDVHGCTNAEKRMDARERPHGSCHHCKGF